MYEIKTEDVYDILAAVRKCLISVIIQLSQKPMIIQTNLSLAKIKMKLEALRLKNLLD